MNYPYGFTAIAAGKKVKRSSTALALAVALALALPGSAALAGEPIPGVDIYLGKNPGGIVITAPTGKDGTYQFKGLTPGDYDLSVAGQRVQTITVGANRSINGTLMRNDNGKASISVADINGDGVPEARTFTVTVNPVNEPPSLATSVNAEAGVTDRTTTVKGGKPPVGPAGAPVTLSFNTAEFNGVIAAKPGDPPVEPAGAPVNTSRSNKKAGIAENESPRPSTRAINVTSVNDAPSLMGEPIAGVDTKLGRNPGGSIVASSKTDNQGNFHFDKLPAGNYKLIIPGLPSQSLTVGADGIAGGSVKRGSDGNMAIFDRWGNAFTAPKGETFSNKVGDTIPEPVGRSDEANSAMGDVSTTRGTAPRTDGGDTKPGIAEANDAAGRTLNLDAGDGDDALAVPPPMGGDAKPDNSAQNETRTAERNAWDQTWKTRAASPPKDEDVKPGISDQGAAGGLSSYSTAPPPPKGGTLPNTVGTPIQGTDVGLDHDPDGVRVSTTTTSNNGAYGFDKLPAGTYKLFIVGAGQPPKSVTVGPAGVLKGKVVHDVNGNPALLVIAGNIGIGTKSPASGAVRSTGFGSANPARETDIPVGRNTSIPDVPAVPGAGSPGEAMDGAGMRP